MLQSAAIPSSSQVTHHAANLLTTPSSSTVSEPRLQSHALAMKFVWSSRAQRAFTSSLEKVNDKFKNSSFSIFSKGGYSGVVHNQSLWGTTEMRLWLVVLLVGVALLQGNQVIFAYAVGEVGETEGWSLGKKTALLVCSYWGGVATPQVSHLLAESHGGEKVQWAAALIWSLCLPFTMFLMSSSNVVLLALQFVRGMAQGFHVPALLSIVSHRCAEDSQPFFFSSLLSLSYTGPCLIGVLVNFSSSSPSHTSQPSSGHSPQPSSGHSPQPSLSSHWTSFIWLILFLVVPAVGMAWAWLVRCLLKSSGELHKTHYKLAESTKLVKGRSRSSAPGMSDVASSGGRREGLRLEVQHRATLVGGVAKFSWRTAARSPGVVLLLLTQFSVSMFLHVSMTWLPAHWNHAHESDVWLWNVAPWVAIVMGGLGSSSVSWWLTFQRKFSSAVVRNFFTSVSLGGSAVFLVIAGLCGHAYSNMQLACIVGASLFHGISHAGVMVMPFDLGSPSQAGPLFAGLETSKALAGVAGVYLTGFSLTRWDSPSMAFLLMAVFNLVTFILTKCLATGKRQHLEWT